MITASLLNANGIPITDQNKQEANWYNLGAGHVNISGANDPGLVYDIQPNDYIPYLCGLGYTNQQVSIILHHTVRCSSGSIIHKAQLNHPTFSITFTSGCQTYTKTVTNVGDTISTYNVRVNLPSSINVVVTPRRLDFTRVDKKMTYSVTFSRLRSTGPLLVRGYLTWTSTRHVVRSQISIILTYENLQIEILAKKGH
ncbi:hypothetical protein LguiB_028770 [Lonicera macranthoides]